MIIDSFTRISPAQALTATAASTHWVDLVNPRDWGYADSALFVAWRVAAGGTAPTFTVAVQVDDATSFASPTTLVTSKTLPAASMPAGALLMVPIPPFTELMNVAAHLPTQLEFRFARALYTLGGTSPTMTIDAWIAPAKFLQYFRAYASGFRVG